MSRLSSCLAVAWAVAGAVAVLAAPSAHAQTSMNASTRNFVSAAAQSDHFEILEAETALAQTHDPRVRDFAQEMIRDHTRTSEALERATMRAGLAAPPKGLGGDQQKLLGALQSLRGADFDRTYFKQQVLAHQEALVVEQDYAMHGSSPDIKDAARSAVPIIQRHLEMAKTMRAELTGG